MEADPNVLALWLEGADATGSVDPYSDLDVACSVRAGTMEAVADHARAALESLGRLEDLFKIYSLAELKTKSQAASAFFDETAAYLQSLSK